MFRSRLLLTVSAIAVAAATPAYASDMSDRSGQPAVSRPNGKVAIRGGTLDDDGAAIADFSFTAPLGHAFGIQFDGLGGVIDDDGVASGAVHLFWRNPSKGLIGGYVSANTVGGDDFYRFLGEAHVYRGRFSLEGYAGWEEADLDSGAFWLGQVAFYPTENLRLKLGTLYSGWADGDHTAPGTLGMVGLEYQLRSNDRNALSLFSEARFGDDYYAALGGVRLYFGDNKSLLRRHREDDPVGLIPDLDEIVKDVPPPPPQVVAAPPVD